MTIHRERLQERLVFVYGSDQAAKLCEQIDARLHNASRPSSSGRQLNQEDVMLITYGDQVHEPEKPPLASLHTFAKSYLQGIASAIHILPFYPYTSDDGFSVVDYKEVDPNLGQWSDVRSLAQDFDLMFDAVVNHISAHSPWFKRYLAGDPAFAEYFIEADPEADYASVTRPRALPLLTEVETAHGPRHVWTTFSADQIDLNFRCPEVFLAVLDVLLFYVSQGARFIRLDAIGYLWKELGTSCIHLDQTHAIIQVYRQVLDAVAPDTVIITETNVPHADNISYLGGEADEAHMVYQFPLPPLTLYAFVTGNAKPLTQWAAGIKTATFPKPGTTFFNFLASHDGIGVMPTRGILSEDDVATMIKAVEERGGLVSYKDNGDGTKSPYELNINYLSALSHPNDSQETRVLKMLGAHTILLSLAGVPGVYFHSLVGSENYRQGVEESGIPRRINREKLDLGALVDQLETTGSLRQAVYHGLRQRIALRRQRSAFHPEAAQEVVDVDDRLFVLLRGAGRHRVLTVVNTSDQDVQLRWPLPSHADQAGPWRDAVDGTTYEEQDGQLVLNIAPYASHWLEPV